MLRESFTVMLIWVGWINHPKQLCGNLLNMHKICEKSVKFPIKKGMSGNSTRKNQSLTLYPIKKFSIQLLTYSILLFYFAFKGDVAGGKIH